MRRLLGLTISLGVAGVFQIPASALAQAQKAVEPKAAVFRGEGVELRVIPRRQHDLDFHRKNLDATFRQYFVTEYYFIRNVCSPTPEQAKIIAREGERAFQKMVLERAEAMHKAAVAGGPAPLGDVRANRRTMRSEMAGIAKDHLNSQQFGRLQDEVAKRTATEREVAIAAMLDVIDKELILGADQREEIRRSLASHWQDDWILSTDYFLFRQYRLPIPSAYVVEFLNENQRKAWEEFQKFAVVPPLRIADTPIPSIHRPGGPLEDAALREAYQAEFRAREAAKGKKTKEVPR